MSPCRSPHRSHRPADARKHRGVGALAIALLLVVGPGLARAAESADAETLRRAEALATEAKVFFGARLFDKASLRFMEAYALARRPSLMYNAARAYEEARDYREAVALFKHYRLLPDVTADGRADADTRIARMEAELAATAVPEPKPRPAPDPVPAPMPAEPTAVAVPVPLAPRDPASSEPAPPPVTAHGAAAPKFPGWQVAAAGGAWVIGAAMWFVAWDRAEAARALDVRSNEDIDKYQRLGDDARLWRNMALGSAAIGAGLAAWVAYDVLRGPGPAAPPAASIALTPGGGRVVWSGRF